MVSRRRNERRLEVRLASDARQFDRGFDRARQTTQGFDRQMDQASRQGIGRFNSQMDVARQRLSGFVAIAGAALAGGALIRWAGQLRESANALTESVNAVNVVFGEGAESVLEFGENAAESVGLARSEFQQLVTPVGSILQEVGGFDAQEAADGAIELTERAADLASVFNTEVPEALTAIQAALRGESDPIERFGASINAAAVEAFLLEEGLVDSASAITDSDKVFGRFRLIMEQTERVAGDFANTSEENANQTRIFQSRMEDLRAEVGQAVVPAFDELLEAGGDVIPVLEDMGTNVVPALVDAFGDFIAGVGEIIETIGDIPDGVKIASGALLGLLGTARLLYAHPVIAGLGAVTAGIVAIGNAARDEAEQVLEMKEALEELRLTGEDETLIQTVRQDIAGFLADSPEAIETARELGLTLTDLAKGVIGGEEYAAEAALIKEAITDARQAALEASDPLQTTFEIDQQTGGLLQLHDVVERVRDRHRETVDTLEEERRMQRLLNDEGELEDKQAQQRARTQRELGEAVDSVLDPSEERLEQIEEERLRTEELDESVGELANTYAQQLNKAAQGFLDIFSEAPEVESEGIDQLLTNAEERLGQVNRFFSGLETLREQDLFGLEEIFREAGPESLGDLEAILADLDEGGGRAFELNETIEKGRQQIRDMSTEFGLELAEQKVPMLAEFQNLGVDLGEALAEGLDSVTMTLGIDASATGVRTRGLGQRSTTGGSTPVRQHGGRVWPDHPFIVGERRPEVFVPDTAGDIVPSVGQFVSDTLRQGGGGTSTHSLTVQLTQQFYGNTDPEAAGLAARRGIARELEIFERGMPGRRN